ncbi:MAG: hypothetical protein J6I53_08325 [Treponema sp.]|nr:hypothetical protein [Treponema sp.]
MNSNRYAKSFVFVFLIILAIAVARWILLVNVQYSYMDGEFPYWMQQKDYVHTKNDKSEVLFMGDSRMKAGIIPERICDNAYNLAVGGGSMVEMYYSLKGYLKNHPEPEMVVLGFAAYHYAREYQFESRNLYFHFLPLEYQIEAQIEKYISGQPGLKNKLIDTMKYDLFFPQKYSAACINSKFKREKHNRTLFQTNAAAKGHMYFGKNEKDERLNQETSFRGFNVNPHLDNYLHKIIDLCQKNEIPLFIEQLPMNTPSWNKINENGFYADYRAYMESVMKEMGIPVELEIPCYDVECFGDSSHMNSRGAEKFSSEIKEKYQL